MGNRERLRYLMVKHSLKAHEVAYFLDLRPQTVRAMMCGARRISPGQLLRLRRAVGE